MITVLSVFGTRPEAIKMAPVIHDLEGRGGQVRSVVCFTGQHRSLVEQVCEIFSIRPDVDLDVMRHNQNLSGLTSRLIADLAPVVGNLKPDWVLAQGDTTTVLAAALVAYYNRVRFGHLEAGLRTGDLFNPFPEELNRRVADMVASALFAPTQTAACRLVKEGHPAERIILTGNTVVDALHAAAEFPYDWAAGPLAAVPRDRRLVVVTAHRRESFGAPLRQMCQAVRDLALGSAADGVHVVFPCHLNPNVAVPVQRILGPLENVTVTEPLDYLSFVNLLKAATFVMTDSGGIQEEAPVFGLPVLVMRDTTERTESVDAGVARLVGTERRSIARAAARLLGDSAAYAAMAKRICPYGDGRAAQRIVDTLLRGQDVRPCLAPPVTPAVLEGRPDAVVGG